MIMDPLLLAFDSALLALESSTVVGMRMFTLCRGGSSAADEASRMVSEKWLAGAQAALRLGTGGTAGDVVGAYRAVVHANHVRLAQS